ncbi:MAG TPA: cellulase family glycosylhydrolase [Cyclobacteriaceae bacterium]|nr:cellulase family glycosylhydrolase [Cyclobacteriaceae bacterium]
MKTLPYLFLALCLSIAFTSCNTKQKETSSSNADSTATVARDVWTKEQAMAWYQPWGWLRGCDFIPSTAINQLEMWQAETFDTATINRELGYAESIGMNAMRVYLHHLAWEIDQDGFKDRMNQFLTIADKHGISTLFVIFDDCWNPGYQPGKQPDPKPGIHNSGWVRDPGDIIHEDSTVIVSLEKYVKDILTFFGNDNRILLWDLYNEPGNSGYGNKSMPLLQKAFQWGREVNPSQPLSAGVWSKDLVDLNNYQLQNSDVITYHNYSTPDDHKKWIDSLRTYGRPLICTEYMARTRGSRFDNIMPMLKSENVGAFNWGLVSGKTNTIYAWDAPMPDGKEPKVWFHDIFRKDGTPYDKKEVDLIRSLTSVK